MLSCQFVITNIYIRHFSTVLWVMVMVVYAILSVCDYKHLHQTLVKCAVVHGNGGLCYFFSLCLQTTTLDTG